MARRVIIDTDVLVGSGRNRTKVANVLEASDDVAIAAVTIAELRNGIELADETHRADGSRFLQEVLATLPVENYDFRVAQAHGRLLAHVHRSGSTRDAIDLIIAATALVTRRTIITTDARARFDELLGVDCLVVRAP